jgi:hypothetical protein
MPSVATDSLPPPPVDTSTFLRILPLLRKRSAKRARSLRRENRDSVGSVFWEGMRQLDKFTEKASLPVSSEGMQRGQVLTQAGLPGGILGVQWASEDLLDSVPANENLVSIVRDHFAQDYIDPLNKLKLQLKETSARMKSIYEEGQRSLVGLAAANFLQEFKLPTEEEIKIAGEFGIIHTESDPESEADEEDEETDEQAEEEAFLEQDEREREAAEEEESEDPDA